MIEYHYTSILVQGPAVTMVRRHNRGSDRFHYGPALQTVSGNYVAAKRRGVVDGIDYGFTGTVRTSCMPQLSHSTLLSLQHISPPITTITADITLFATAGKRCREH